MIEIKYLISKPNNFILFIISKEVGIKEKTCYLSSLDTNKESEISLGEEVKNYFIHMK